MNADQTLSTLPGPHQGSGNGEEGLNRGRCSGGPDRADGGVGLVALESLPESSLWRNGRGAGEGWPGGESPGQEPRGLIS